jgi:hypothetical protein
MHESDLCMVYYDGVKPNTPACPTPTLASAKVPDNLTDRQFAVLTDIFTGYSGIDWANVKDGGSGISIRRGGHLASQVGVAARRPAAAYRRYPRPTAST